MAEDLKNWDRSKLPRAVFRDGAKWLMAVSKMFLDGLSVWPERQNATTFFLHFLVVLSYIIIIIGGLFYMTDSSVGLAQSIYEIAIVVVSLESLLRRVLCYIYKEKLSAILSKVYFEFWPSNKLGDDLHRKIFRESKLVFLFVAVYTFSAFICCTQYIVLPLFTGNLPMRSKFPHVPYKQSPYYELLYVWEAGFALELAFNVCGLDLFFVSLLFNCVAQFKLIREFVMVKFDEIVQEGQYDNERAMQVLIVFIRRHNKLIQVCKEIEQAFTFFILVQYLTSMGTVCVSAFVVTTLPSDAGSSFTYLIGHVCELLIYCYMGNELSLESMKLSDAIFQSGWHLFHANKDVQKILLMVMLRAQRPVRISAGGFGYLSLQAYVKLLQFSFSVYTLLKKQDNTL